MKYPGNNYCCALIVVLLISLFVQTNQINAQRDTFQRTKPHVNIGIVYDPINDNDMVDARKLGGFKLGMSVDGSDVFPLKQVSENIFNSEREYADSRFALVIDVEHMNEYIDWVNKFFADQPVSKTAVIYLLGRNFREKAIRNFYDAYITETTFPSMDGIGNNKEKKSGDITLHISGENRVVKSKRLIHKLDTEPNKQFYYLFQWGSITFKNIVKVDSFTIKRLVTKKDGKFIPGHIEYPNITFTIQEADIIKWREAFKTRTPNNDMPGKLTMISVDGDKKYASIIISGVRLVSLKKLPEGQLYESTLSVEAIRMESI